MKQKLILLFLTPFAFIFSQPKASFEQDSIKFGIVYAGEVRTAKIVLKNIGNKPLEIVQVQTTCGCTTTKQPTGMIAPGKSDDIEITYNSAGAHGEIHKQVYVTTNDPTGESFAVHILGMIKEEFEAVGVAGTLWLSTIPLGKPVEQAIAWKNISGKSISIRNASTDSDQLKLNWERKTIAPDGTYSLQLVATPAKENYQSGTITLETDSPRQKFVTLKVSFIGLKEAKP